MKPWVEYQLMLGVPSVCSDQVWHWCREMLLSFASSHKLVLWHWCHVSLASDALVSPVTQVLCLWQGVMLCWPGVSSQATCCVRFTHEFWWHSGVPGFQGHAVGCWYWHSWHISDVRVWLLGQKCAALLNCRAFCLSSAAQSSVWMKTRPSASTCTVNWSGTVNGS